mgnify:FL=1|tara:strand:- start:103 stop:558 length:456 start_codon:yes stop_codon:yes gene_type:complete
MTELITDEIKSWIGRSDDPVEFEVSQRDIVKYAIATDQKLDKYVKGEEAPPMFLFGADRPLTSMEKLGPDGLRKDTLVPELPLKRVMAGGVKKRYHGKIKPGDILTIERTISDIFEKTGKTGPLIFVVYQINVKNQDGELVLQEEQTRINR